MHEQPFFGLLDVAAVAAAAWEVAALSTSLCV